MSNSLIIFTLLILSLTQSIGFSSFVYAGQDESEEPPLSVKLFVDGKQIDTQIGQETDVLSAGKNVRIKVVADDERELQLRHLRFRYPAYFKFEVSCKRGTQVPVRWDLVGQDVDITVFRMSSAELKNQKSKRPLGDWMSRLLDNKEIVTDGGILELGQANIQGTKYTSPITLGRIKTELSFDIYEVPGSFGELR